MRYPLPELAWMSDGFPYAPASNRSSILVLAGDPDADAAWDTGVGFALDAVSRGGLGVVVDATASNPTPEGLVGMYVSRLEFVGTLVESMEWVLGDVLVLHSLDAWPDWSLRVVMEGLRWASDACGLTVVIHTKVTGMGTVFGGDQLGKVVDATLWVREGSGCEYLWGRGLYEMRGEGSERDGGE